MVQTSGVCRSCPTVASQAGMLPLEISKRWLDENLSMNEYRAILNYELPSEELVYRTVYTLGVERQAGLADNEPYVWKKKQEELWGEREINGHL